MKGFSWPLLLVGMVVAFCLQSTVLWPLAPAGVHLDLALLLVVSTGLLGGAAMGAGAGALAGILGGAFSWGLGGILMLAYGLAGFAAGLLGEWIPPEFPLAAVGGAEAGTAVFLVVLVGGMLLLEGQDAILLSWEQMAWLGALHGVLILPVFALSRRLLVRARW